MRRRRAIWALAALTALVFVGGCHSTMTGQIVRREGKYLYEMKNDRGRTVSLDASREGLYLPAGQRVEVAGRWDGLVFHVESYRVLGQTAWDDNQTLDEARQP